MSSSALSIGTSVEAAVDRDEHSPRFESRDGHAAMAREPPLPSSYPLSDPIVSSLDICRSRTLTSAPDWHPIWLGVSDDNALVRQFTFPSFPDAIAFVTRLAFDAEAADHHPDLTVQYKRVTVTWSTHSEGGVTAKDFDGRREGQGRRRLQAVSAGSGGLMATARAGRGRPVTATLDPEAVSRTVSQTRMRLKTSYSSREVAALTGLTARQLQGWDATRVFPPAIAPRRTTRAASRSGGTRRSTCSSCSRSPNCAAAASRRPTLKQMMDTLRDYFRRRLSETLDDAGEMRLLTDGKRPVPAHAAGSHLRPARRSDAAARHRRRACR